jgi:hypothetical protein
MALPPDKKKIHKDKRKVARRGFWTGDGVKLGSNSGAFSFSLS